MLLVRDAHMEKVASLEFAEIEMAGNQRPASHGS